MYYDPMISKLVTWAPDRAQAMDLLDKCIDQYVVQGVAHNLGFAKSIIHNESFAAGDYTTAFIPDFYPEGYNGDILNGDQKRILALAGHQLKNIHLGYNDAASLGSEKVAYVTVLAQNMDEVDHDWRVEKSGPTAFKVTDMATNESSEVELSNFDFSHNSLIKMKGDAKVGAQTFQLLSADNDMKFNFFYQGGKVETIVYDEA